MYISNENINFDDQNAIKDIRIEDVQAKVDNKFGGQKSFLCLRVFSQNDKEKIQFTTLENLAQQGKLLPIPDQVTTYLLSSSQSNESPMIEKV